MALAGTEMLLTTPLALLQMIIGLTGQPLDPWRSWADTHSDFSRVDLVPSVIWRYSGMPAVALEITRWSAPLCAFVFFLFFGFAEESRRNYWRAIDFVLVTCKIGWRTSSERSKPGCVPLDSMLIHAHTLSQVTPAVFAHCHFITFITVDTAGLRFTTSSILPLQLTIYHRGRKVPHELLRRI